MHVNLRNLLTFSVLIIAALASWLWSRDGAIDTPQSGLGRSVPLGYYLTEATILGTDEDGRALYRIRAGHAEEQPDEERLVLNDVTVDYQPGAEVPWTLKATNGEAPLNESYLDLSGEVELARGPQEGGAGPTVIRTAQLRLEPGDFVAQTEDPVSVFFGDRRLDAVGMRADLKEDNLQLESNVHGQFRP